MSTNTNAVPSYRYIDAARAVLILVALVTSLFIAISVVAPPAAEASHAGYMTIRGKVSPVNGNSWQHLAGARVKLFYWTGSYWYHSRTTTSNSYGNYAITAGRQHWFYLEASRSVGTMCQPYGAGIWSWIGNTNSFYTYASWSNPTYINVPANGGRVC